MTGHAWITSEWCATWHVVERSARGAVLVTACGHPLCGRMSRVLGPPIPGDDREICQACLVAARGGEESDAVRARLFETALGVMVENRGFHAVPLPEWPQEDPDQPHRPRLPEWNTGIAA